MISSGPDIITNGLIFSIDPNNYKSYTSGSTKVYDLMTYDILTGSMNNVNYTTNFPPSFVFNGTSNYINFGNVGSLTLTESATICAWVYIPATWTSGDMYPNLVSKGATAGWDTPGWSLYTFKPGGGVNVIGVGMRSGSVVNSRSFNNNIFDKWVYISGTWNGSNIYVYRNGIQQVSLVQTVKPPETTTNVYIGADVGGQDFFGNTGAIQIYNRALSANELLQNYESLRSKYGV